MKHEVNQRLHTKTNTLRVSDLLLNEPPSLKIKNKLQPKRYLTPYTITTINNSTITATLNSHTITRNSSHFKLFHPPLEISISDASLPIINPIPVNTAPTSIKPSPQSTYLKTTHT